MSSSGHNLTNPSTGTGGAAAGAGVGAAGTPPTSPGFPPESYNSPRATLPAPVLSLGIRSPDGVTDPMIPFFFPPGAPVRPNIVGRPPLNGALNSRRVINFEPG